MFSGGEVDQTPILEETMNSDDAANVTHQSSTTVGCWKVFLYILSPHDYHWVSIEFVQPGVQSAKRKGQILIALFEKLREGLFLNVVYWM